MNKEELLGRTRQFAVKVFKLIERFPKSKAADVVAYQLLKSSSSVAANFRAVNKAKSKNDFINKMKIVLEESDESNFWLNFIEDIQLIKVDSDLKFLIKESDEFVAIFTSAIKTLNQKSKI